MKGFIILALAWILLCQTWFLFRDVQSYIRHEEAMRKFEQNIQKQFGVKK